MELLGFSASQVHSLASLAEAGSFLSGNAAALFVWADFSTEEVTAAPDAWRESVRQLAGAPILDLHLADATNAAHPSYFDTTNAYDMVIFRKLTFETSRAIAEAEPQEAAAGTAGTAKAPGADAAARPKRHPPGFLPALARIDTQPVTFFVFDTVLVTVRSGSRARSTRCASACWNCARRRARRPPPRAATASRCCTACARQAGPRT